VWVSIKPLTTEEIWPAQGLILGLPNETSALYPLLHELMLRKKLKGYILLQSVFLVGRFFSARKAEAGGQL
jgi:hypothetical protein